MIEIIKNLLGFGIPHPFKKRTGGGKQAEMLPDNITYTKGQAFVEEWTEENVYHADKWTGQTGQRTDRIGPIDLDIIKERKLKESLYRELKVYWAAHYSARMASREKGGKRGYGLRTLEKYWAGFNEVDKKLNPSPTD